MIRGLQAIYSGTRRGLMALGLVFPLFAYWLRNATPTRCTSIAYSAGFEKGKIVADRGRLAGFGPDASWFCGMFYPEFELYGALGIASLTFIGMTVWHHRGRLPVGESQ